MIKPFEIVNVKYTKKDTSESSERIIIPTTIPANVIKALDVTHLTEEERSRMERLYKEYQDYCNVFLSKLFNFDDWLSHTQDEQESAVKWRTFNINQMEIID